MDRIKKLFFMPVYGMSGSGKDFIIKKIIEKEPEMFNYLQSWTTRPGRPEDKENTITSISFTDMQDKKEREHMVTHTVFGEYEYACFYSDMKDGKINIRPIDPLGIKGTLTYHSKVITLPLKITCSEKKRFERVIGSVPVPSEENFHLHIKKVLERLEREKPQYEYISIKDFYVWDNNEDSINVTEKHAKRLIMEIKNYLHENREE